MVAQFSSFFSLLCLAGAAVVNAAPLERTNALARRAPSELAVRETISLNGWGGVESLQNFDNFRGKENFDGRNNQVVVIQQQQVVCVTQQIEIIQQRLVILQEMAKKIITQQICEVETQTIVLAQFNSGVQGFGEDIKRKSGKPVGYDKAVADKGKELFNEDGSLSTNDLGIDGKSVGSQLVVPSGGNWNDTESPARVQAAQEAADKAKDKTE